jgi:alpha-L-arabinofuranosidase
MTRPGGPAWRQTIFHPFALTSRYARGQVLRPAVVSPQVSTSAYGDVDALLSTATYDPDTGDLVIFAVNRSRTLPVTLEANLSAFEPVRMVEHLMLHDDDSGACNTEAEPDRVVPRPGAAEVTDTTLTSLLPPASWHCIRLSVSP